jgi:hypothetical protein
MKPTKGRIVLVTTPGRPINGQEEHAAIITQVWSETMINTVTFPGIGEPRNVTSVGYADPPHATQQSWRWPPRE